MAACLLSVRAELRYANESHDRTRPTRQARREEPLDASRGIHSLGDRAHPPGQAWRAQYEAGDRDRPERSASRRRGSAAAEERPDVGTHAALRGAGLRNRPGQTQAAQPITSPRARDGKRPEARRPRRRLARGAVPPRQTIRRGPSSSGRRGPGRRQAGERPQAQHQSLTQQASEQQHRAQDPLDIGTSRIVEARSINTSPRVERHAAPTTRDGGVALTMNQGPTGDRVCRRGAAAD